MTLRKWLKRILAAALVLAVCAVVATAVLVRNLETSLQWALKSKFPALEFTFDSLEISRKGELHINKATVRQRRRHDSKPAIRVASIHAGFRWSELTNKKIDWITVELPELIIDQKLLDAFSTPSLQDPVPNAPSAETAPIWHIPEITITGGRTRLQIDGIPEMTFNIEALTSEDDHTLIRLSDVQVEPESSTIDLIELEIDRGQMLTEHRINRLLLKDADLHITEQLLDRIRSATKPAKQDTRTRKTSETTSDSSSQDTSLPSKNWTVDQLIINNNRLTVSGLTANVPPIQATLNTALEGVTSAKTGPDAARLHTVHATSISVGEDRESPIFATIDALTFKFSMAGIHASQIASLEITSPVIKMAGIPEPTTSPPPPPHPKSKNASATPPSKNALSDKIPSWTLDRFVITNGELFLSKFGARIPESSLKFSANWDHFSTAPNTPGFSRSQRVDVFDLRLAVAYAPLEPFLSIARAGVGISMKGITDRKLDFIELDGGELVIDRPLRSLLTAQSAENSSSRSEDKPAKGPVPAAQANPSTSPSWILSSLTLDDLHIVIANLGEGIPSIGFDFQTSMADLPLSPDELGTNAELKQVELSDFSIRSPLDPWAPVVTMNSIFINFSLAQLMQQEIEELIILQPTIYIGEDLFWYVDELKRKRTEEQEAVADPQAAADPTSAKADAPNWRLQKFKIAGGKLAIATDGAARVSLPIGFKSEAENISFSSLNDLQLKLNIAVPKEDYPFPSYELELRDLHGDIEFGLPPASGATNLVQTLYSKETIWKQLRGQDLWLSVTYDREGIYSEFGGAFYGGYVNGGFTFYLIDNFPWTGWLTGSDIDMKLLTDVLAPHNFQLTGPASMEVQINAEANSIERAIGWFNLNDEGIMNINKIDDFLAVLPSEWGSIKRDLTTIGLETMRDFDYEKGRSDFWFIGKHGQLTLNLEGPLGSRNFEVLIHDTQLTHPGLWQREINTTRTTLTETESQTQSQP